MRPFLPAMPTPPPPTWPAVTSRTPTGNKSRSAGMHRFFIWGWTASAVPDRAIWNFQPAIAYHPLEGGAMYCNYCGKLIQDDAAVCAYCGIRVGASMARTRLVRPRAGRKVAGVCLGFSEYFD